MSFMSVSDTSTTDYEFIKLLVLAVWQQINRVVHESIILPQYRIIVR